MKKKTKIVMFAMAFVAVAASLGIATKAMNSNVEVESTSLSMKFGLDEVVTEDTKYYAEFELDVQAGERVAINITASNDAKKTGSSFLWYYGFDEDTKGTYKVDLSRVFSDMTSEYFQDYEWTVIFRDSLVNNVSHKISNIKFYDTTTGNVYGMDLDETVTVDGLKKNITMDTDIAENEQGSNVSTIYYKGYSNPNIHYKVGNGNWTNVPGVAMAATSEMDGYTHKATIDLGDADTLTFCFNDGNNNWDSKYGLNYTAKKGIYTYTSGNVTKISEGELKANLYTSIYGPIALDEAITLKAEVAGATGECEYRFGITNNGVDTILRDYSAEKSFKWTNISKGVYNLFVDVKDSTGTVVRSNIDDFEANAVSGNTINLSTYKCVVGDLVKANPIFNYEVIGESKNVYKYYVNVYQDDAVTEIEANGDNSLSWIPTESGTYIITAEVTDAMGNTAKTIGSVDVADADDSLRVSYSTKTTSVIITGCNYTYSIDAEGGTEPYTYSYKYVLDGEETVLVDKTDSAFATFVVPKEGRYTFYATVTDANGESITVSDEFVSESIKIDSINFNPEEAAVGDTVELSVTTRYERYYRFANQRLFTITNVDTNEVEELTANITTDFVANWTPEKAGTYKVDVEVYSYGSSPVSASTTFEVEEAEDTINQTIIYYSGYNNPYIHYSIGGGAWTNVPGVAMNSSNEMSGYTHKAIVDLGEANTLTACFNDGNGNWDSANGRNYSFGVGTYTYSNGNITKIK